MEVKMVAKFSALPIRKKLLIAVLLLWLVVAWLNVVTYTILNFVLHSDYKIVSMIAMLVIFSPIIILANKETSTWRQLIIKFGKSLIFFLTGLAIFFVGAHLGIDFGSEFDDSFRANLICWLVLLPSFLWAIYFFVKAARLLIPKREVKQ